MSTAEQGLQEAVYRMDLADPEIPQEDKAKSRTLLQRLREKISTTRSQEKQETELTGQLEPLIDAVTTELEKLTDWKILSQWSTTKNSVVSPELAEAIKQLSLKDEEVRSKGYETSYAFRADSSKIDVRVRKESNLLPIHKKNQNKPKNFETALNEYVAIQVREQIKDSLLIPLKADLDEINTLEDFKNWFGISESRVNTFDEYVELTKNKNPESNQRRKHLWDGYFIENVRHALNPVIEQGISEGGYTDLSRDTDHWFYLSLHGQTFSLGERMIIEKLRNIILSPSDTL